MMLNATATYSATTGLRASLVGLGPLAALLLVTACGPTVPSTARLRSVRFVPAADGVSVRETTFSYDDNGQPERAEVDLGGSEILEEIFSFNEDGELTEIVSTETTGTLALLTIIRYDWTDGRITRVASEGSGIDDPDGTNISYVTSSERDINYDDQGRVSRSTIESHVHLEQTLVVEIPIFDDLVFELTADINDTTSEDFDWDDSGELNRIDSIQSQTSINTQDGEESARTLRTQVQTLDLDYDDEGLTEGFEISTSITDTDNDMVVTESTTDFRSEFRFNDDKQVRDVSENRDGSSEGLDIDFDDEGRISQVENDAGDRWEFDYGDEPVKSVTFRAARLPSMLDMAGRPALSVFGSPTHLGY